MYYISIWKDIAFRKYNNQISFVVEILQIRNIPKYE